MRNPIRTLLLTLPAALISTLSLVWTGPASAEPVPAKVLAVITAMSSDCTHFDATKIDAYTFNDPTQNGTSSGEYTIYQVPCSLAAYNTAERYFLQGPYGDVTPVAFATPVVKTVYEDPQEMTRTKSISITTYSSQISLSNSSFDAQFRSISASHKWRGIGDASEGGTWRFEGGQFVLESYALDPTFDGQTNVVTVWFQGKAID